MPAQMFVRNSIAWDPTAKLGDEGFTGTGVGSASFANYPPCSERLGQALAFVRVGKPTFEGFAKQKRTTRAGIVTTNNAICILNPVSGNGLPVRFAVEWDKLRTVEQLFEFLQFGLNVLVADGPTWR